MKLKIYSYKGVKSTNDTAIRLIKQNIKQGIVTSDIQINGKGQRGKTVSYTHLTLPTTSAV